jgi:hypothetical protein
MGTGDERKLERNRNERVKGEGREGRRQGGGSRKGMTGLMECSAGLMGHSKAKQSKAKQRVRHSL